MKKTFLALALAAFSSVAVQAASMTFTLTQDACTGTCGSAPFGTITLLDNGSGSSAFVTVTLTLAANERFAGTGAGEALEFNLSPSVGTVSLTTLSDTTHFQFGVGGATASAFGSFTNFIDCKTCQGGQAGNAAGPVSFHVGGTNGVTVASFVANAGGNFFAADIVGNNGNTGNVGAKTGVAVTPEPSTWLLLSSSLIGLGLIRRKRSN